MIEAEPTTWVTIKLPWTPRLERAVRAVSRDMARPLDDPLPPGPSASHIWLTCWVCRRPIDCGTTAEVDALPPGMAVCPPCEVAATVALNSDTLQPVPGNVEPY